jgi:hypothetical protein
MLTTSACMRVARTLSSCSSFSVRSPSARALSFSRRGGASRARRAGICGSLSSPHNVSSPCPPHARHAWPAKSVSCPPRALTLPSLVCASRRGFLRGERASREERGSGGAGGRSGAVGAARRGICGPLRSTVRRGRGEGCQGERHARRGKRARSGARARGRWDDAAAARVLRTSPHTLCSLHAMRSPVTRRGWGTGGLRRRCKGAERAFDFKPASLPACRKCWRFTRCWRRWVGGEPCPCARAGAR